MVYVVAVVALAVGTFVVYALGDRNELGWALATPGLLFVGALAAFVKTYRDWRANRTWPIWQGAGWFLLTLSLLALGVPAMGMFG
ncbi:MAG: hypothetical protein QOK10_1601 [Pseudonocardiales bacterium]|nr:hypothetical protein [Pseudonocardiales bacterium]